MERDTREEQSKWELIEELNELSEDHLKNKERMIEIAKVLVAKYYNYKRDKKENDKK